MAIGAVVLMGRRRLLRAMEAASMSAACTREFANCSHSTRGSWNEVPAKRRKVLRPAPLRQRLNPDVKRRPGGGETADDATAQHNAGGDGEARGRSRGSRDAPRLPRSGPGARVALLRPSRTPWAFHASSWFGPAPHPAARPGYPRAPPPIRAGRVARAGGATR
jgi:hypothetical protein